MAQRKVEGLIAESASVTVVAPEPTERLLSLFEADKIDLQRRPYERGEAGRYALAFAATDDREVNRGVYEDAKSAGVWVNVADDPPLCTFHLPARVRRGTFQLAIASAGEAPFAVRRMRKLLEQKFGPEWAEWMDAAARFRTEVKSLNLCAEDQEQCFSRFFDATVGTAGLTSRVPSREEEEQFLRTESSRPSQPAPGADAKKDDIPIGLVSLVGAGPGDPGLLTLRGRQRLMAADAVVCDRLAVPALPCDLPDTAEIRFVGKTAGNHPVPQDEINAMLVRLAKEGKRVVRLKGGDPYIFGRGGEEAKVLHEAGVPFEVVPCVTAAVAVPTYAGIPITFRNEVVRVTLVTAHEAAKTDGPQVRWDLLATDPHAMLLGYMGVTRLKSVSKKLLDAGMDPDTPAALIERGTTSRQRVVASTVRNLEADVAAAGLKPPALFAIGSTVNHRESLDWFGKRPLLGQRIVVTPNARGLEEELELAGAELVRLTSPITNAARLVMDALPLTGCILADADDAVLIDAERDAPSWTETATAWCLSDAAANRARELGFSIVKDVQSLRSNGEPLSDLIQRTTD